ncbi:MAG TPA: discoidin domain-containing protein [Candidatus Eisenbacteria bacterium]|nr:discoidin domain-containing protein [Candidatus Eisenbacteria bacterium]
MKTFVVLLLLALATPAWAAPTVLDAFEEVDGWEARPADGVELKLSKTDSFDGASLRLDFRFVKGGGYAVIHKKFDFDLPQNYRFKFRIRGTAPSENLEFKLIDSTGENVWWNNHRDFAFPASWDSVSLRKRHLSFAWGPIGGGEIHHVAAIEFAVTAGSGGQGTVWLDQLTLEELPVPNAKPLPIQAKASTSPGVEVDYPGTTTTLPLHSGGPDFALDGNPRTGWNALPGQRVNPWIRFDMGEVREFGGLVIDWIGGNPQAPHPYDVQTSEGDGNWRTVRRVAGLRPRDYLYLPESEARYVRIVETSVAPESPPRMLAEFKVEPVDWSSSLETFYAAIAKDAPRGTYPRGISGEQVFWTVVGADDARDEGLLSEDGAFEVGKRGFTIEPFLWANDTLHTWADAKTTQSLEDGYLPIPSVTQRWGPWELTTTSIAWPTSAAIRYRIRNRAAKEGGARLFVAVRPFQVNPPTQFLNTPGGVSHIESLVRDKTHLLVNGSWRVGYLTDPESFGAAQFDEGDITGFLRRGAVPAKQDMADPSGLASGAFLFPVNLAVGDSVDVGLRVFLKGITPINSDLLLDVPKASVTRELERVREDWRKSFDRVSIALPPAFDDIVKTLQAQIGDVLVNRDSGGIQPGSRSYERSWIRDGSLTSTALLRMGHEDAVKEFIEWFAPYLYADGKVPCCVDARGSDPVPENDSNGEFIYLVAEYFRYTGDRELAERMWPAVSHSAAYLDSMRQTHRTAEWRAKPEFFGLLPPSISHEGYSAKPMHSYWDDLFALRGFKDAAYLAGALGRNDEARRWAAARDEFQKDLVASMNASMATHKIDYIPGAADLGDFDATSTTIALEPVQGENALPHAALEQTFQRYYQFFRDRKMGKKTWDAFTPYEVRNIGAFIRLGWRDRAQELNDWFLKYRKPVGWRQWPEVVWHDERKPHFIGDLPHTWVGSDYVRSILDCFAYDRERDSTLVLAAGVPWTWVSRGSGVGIDGLRTPYGKLNYTLRAKAGGAEMHIEDGIRVPSGGLVVRAPSPTKAFRSAIVNGKTTPINASGEVVVREVPADIQLR